MMNSPIQVAAPYIRIGDERSKVSECLPCPMYKYGLFSTGGRRVSDKLQWRITNLEVSKMVSGM